MVFQRRGSILIARLSRRAPLPVDFDSSSSGCMVRWFAHGYADCKGDLLEAGYEVVIGGPPRRCVCIEYLEELI
jgi:hypothetical protein